MKTKNIIPEIRTKYRNYKFAKHEKFLSDHVCIHSDNFGGNYQELFNAREVIANFAKKNNIVVDILDAEETCSISISSKGKAKAKTSVWQTILKDEEILSVNGDYVIERNNLPLNHRNGKFRTEGSFLKYVYAQIDELTKTLHKKP